MAWTNRKMAGGGGGRGRNPNGIRERRGLKRHETEKGPAGRDLSFR